MKDLAKREISRVDWSLLPVMGDRSSSVPTSLIGLLEARSEDEAEKFYWKLENVVVVQGQLFEAAPATVSVLLAALAEGVSSVVKAHVLELIFQLVAGESEEDAVARGNAALGDECRVRAREGIWTLYSELVGEHHRAVRDILARIDQDESRLTALGAS